MAKLFFVCLTGLLVPGFIFAQSNNPYDQIGERHNELVNLARSESFENNAAMADFLFEKMSFMGLDGSVTREVVVARLEALANCNYALDCFIQGETAGNLASEMTGLISVLESKETVAAFQSAVEVYAGAVAGKRNLTENEKNATLAFCATAWHSAVLWGGDDTQPLGRWKRIALYDAAGALIGFVAGGGFWGAVGLGAACSLGAARTGD